VPEVTKSITLDGGGQTAGVLTSGTNGIVVSAGAADVVTLRNLDINGLTTGLSGILWISGAQLRLEHDVIREYGATGGACIDDKSNTVRSQMAVIDTQVINCSAVGIRVAPSGGVVARATLDRVTLDQNAVGLIANDGARVFVRNSEIAMNAGDGVLVNGGGGANAFVFLTHTSVVGTRQMDLRPAAQPARKR
jgi:hypothetical protein